MKNKRGGGERFFLFFFFPLGIIGIFVLLAFPP